MTTHKITAPNLNTALLDALWWLKVSGVEEPSRNGTVLVAPGPVITEYLNPTHRVIFSRRREANPFFHLFESLWMLGGRNDVNFVKRYAANIASYSDDAVTFHSAYGHRWREHFGFDQLQGIVDELARDPHSRRAVLSMWDARSDLVTKMGGMKDLPCNTAAYFDLRGGCLNMTVVNRSNDAIWGCYGANAVHFSVLLEYLANELGVCVGVYRQFSNNFHVYTEREDTKRLLYKRDGMYEVKYTADDRYTMLDDPVSPLQGSRSDEWHVDLVTFLNRPLSGCDDYKTQAFQEIICPLAHAHEHYRHGNAHEAVSSVGDCLAQDWRLAALDWLSSRPSMMAKLGLTPGGEL